jgi:hypothetical protein
VKTFWRWRDTQLPDGTVILNAPTGHTYVTTPGSALLFPSLCVPTSELPPRKRTHADSGCADRTAMMPRRRRTRAQIRAARIAIERRQSHDARTTPEQRSASATPTSLSHPGPTTTHHHSESAGAETSTDRRTVASGAGNRTVVSVLLGVSRYARFGLDGSDVAGGVLGEPGQLTP